MKLNTKVSNRDKSLLVFLIVILILFVAYYFFFQPQLDQLLATKGELNQAESELSSIDQQIASLSQLQAQEKDLLAKIDAKVAPFFYELKDDRLLNQFNTMMGQNHLNMQSYSVTPATVSTIVMPVYNPQIIAYPALDAAAKVNPDLQDTDDAGNNADGSNSSPDNGETQSTTEGTTEEGATEGATAAAPENLLLVSTLSISFIDSTYEAVIGFLKSIEAMDKAIVVSDINIAAQQSGVIGFGGTLQGQIQLTLYSLAKPENSEKDFLSFYNSFPIGKANPFN